ncbi:MAG: O-antigen ligase family protein, partial [Oscillospiraceae bacterium]|nr:O-antigen ligase family protein [Oscillospiraceae bacterium]
LAFGWIALRIAGSKKPLKSRFNPMDGFVLVYLLTGLLLLILASTDQMSIHITGFRASMQYLLVFFMITRLIRHDKDFMDMYKLLVLIATVLAAYGVFQYIIGVEIPDQWTDSAEGDVRTRVFAIFSNPNVLGGYMVLFAPMAFGMAYATKKLSGKIFYWGCGLCMCGACLFTMSRGSWVALAIAAVLFALVVDRKLFGLLVIGGCIACFLPFVRSRIGYLFTPEFRESNQRGGRGIRWDRAFSYVTQGDAWATGLGYGMYGGAVAMQNQINPNYVYTYVDNYYVKTIAETGLIGLSALVTMLSGLLWNGARACARNSGTEYKPLCTGMLVGLIGVLVQMYFECLWEEPYFMALYFVVAAMLIYAGFLRKKENN